MTTRSFILALTLLASAALSGCAPVIGSIPDPQLTPRDQAMMALATPEEWSLPTNRAKVAYFTKEKPGTIVIDTGGKHLYFVLPNNEAIQYRVATGAEAYGWTGRATVGRKQEWPTLDADRLDHGALAGIPRLYRPRTARRRLGQSARRARALSLSGQPRHALSHPRHQRAVRDRS